MNYLWLLFANIVIAQAYANVFPRDDLQSKWTFVQQPRLSCTLHQPVAEWGWASFMSHSGKETNLSLRLHPKFRHVNDTQIYITATPPRWKPGHTGYFLHEQRSFDRYDNYLEAKDAWNALDALHQGHFLSIQYRNYYHNDRQTRVLLSPLNFKKIWNEFTDCIDGLLPYSFQDVSLSVLRFESNSDNLTLASRMQLKKIGEYVRFDPTIERIQVDGYSDRYGGRWHNQMLSERRANRVKAYFAKLGFPETQIQAEGHGERKHISNNEHANERHNNRRVVIQLFRNPSIDLQAILPELPPKPKPKPKKAATPPQAATENTEASAPEGAENNAQVGEGGNP